MKKKKNKSLMTRKAAKKEYQPFSLNLPFILRLQADAVASYLPAPSSCPSSGGNVCHTFALIFSFFSFHLQ